MPQVNIKLKQKIKQIDFKSEEELRKTVENYLSELLNADFVIGKYRISGGEIDTLALDKETGAPVIIEYKVEKAKTIINQLVFYYDWIYDHQDTFDRLVREKLGKNAVVNWSEDIHLICIAKEYTAWDFALVNHLDTEIELMKYAYYSDGSLNVQRVNEGRKQKLGVAREKFDLEYHRNKGNEETKRIFDELRKRVLGLSEDVEERISKYFISYRNRTKTNFMEVSGIGKKNIRLNIRIDRKNFKDPKKVAQNIPKSYLWTLNKRFPIASFRELDYAMNLIKQAHEDSLRR